MQLALTVLVLLGLTSVNSVPLPNVGGHVNKIRDALEHIQQVRSALRRSLDLREAEENSKARSAVRELEDLAEAKRENAGFLGNAMEAIKKSAEMAKRHIETKKRSDDKTREAFKRACGAGLGFCEPEAEQEAKKKREEDNKVLRDVADNIKQAVANLKHKREKETPGSFLGNAISAIKKSVAMTKRHIEQREAYENEKNKRDEGGILRKAADIIKRTVENVKHKRDKAVSRRYCGIGLGFCGPEAEEEENKKKREQETGGFLSNAIDAIKKSVEMTKRHFEQREAYRRDKEENVLRKAADNIKRAVENAKQKRSCGVGLGFCGPEAEEEEKKKREEDEKVLRDVADNIKQAVEKAKHKRGQETGGSFLSNAIGAIKKSVAMTKRHIEQRAAYEHAKRRRDEANAVGIQYKVAENIKRAVENVKQKRSCGVGLGFCGPEAEEEEKKKKREEDNKVLRDVADNIKQAVENLKHKREQETGGSFLSNALNIIKKHAEVAKRHVELERQNYNEKRALRDVADKMREAAENMRRRREKSETTGEKKRWCTDTGYCTDFDTKRNIENFKDAFNAVIKRHTEFQKRKQPEMRALRNVADNIKKAAEKRNEINQRTMREATAGIQRAVEAMHEKVKREEEQRRLFARNPVASSISAKAGNVKQKKSSTSDEDWKRKVREVLDNKAAQIRASAKRYPAFRAAPGQASDVMAKRSKYMGKVGVNWNAKYHPSGSL